MNSSKAVNSLSLVVLGVLKAGSQIQHPSSRLRQMISLNQVVRMKVITQLQVMAVMIVDPITKMMRVCSDLRLFMPILKFLTGDDWDELERKAAKSDVKRA